MRGWDRSRIALPLALAGLLVFGPLAGVSAREQPPDSPRETLVWPSLADPRAALALPLTAFDGRIAARVHIAREIATVAVYDPSANRLYHGGESGPIGGASLSKVLLAVVALWQAEQAGDDDETLGQLRDQLYPTIVVSDNDIPNDIWVEIGGPAGVAGFMAAHGLGGFSTPDPWDWGMVSATAADWAVLFALLGGGRLLNAANTDAVLAMMEDVIVEHRWGVLTPGDDRVVYGKNGWYIDEETTFDWRVNSAGFVVVNEQRGDAPRIVVVMTRYPDVDGMALGIDLATGIANAVVACVHLQQARATLSDRARACTTDRETSQLMARARGIW